MIIVNKHGNTPIYAKEGDAGADLKACLDCDTLLSPGDRILVSTGVKMAIPKGYVGLICPRSGLAMKHGVTVLNAPGIIDSGFIGTIKVILINLSNKPFVIKNGDRIAQIVFTNVSSTCFIEKPVLDDTERGAGGFGSTGV